MAAMRRVGGKTITVYLVDGDPQGTRIGAIGGWTGRGAAASRSFLPGLLQRLEVQRAGVYILAGADLVGGLRERVYIGQADNVAKRLGQHERVKEFWNRVVVFTAADENLTRGHLEYLEASLIEMAKVSSKAVVENKTAPSRTLPEHEQVVMDHFLDEMEVLLPVLGFSFLRSEAPSATAPRFQMKDSGAMAYAVESGQDFVVLAGSIARRNPTPSFLGLSSYAAQRERLVAEGILVDAADPDTLVFSRDMPFATPSLAATMVVGAKRNGRTSWKDDAGSTYAEVQEKQVAEALQSAKSGA